MKNNDTTTHDFPMDTVIPFACIYYAVQFAKEYEIKDNYMQLGFDLHHIKMLTEKQAGMLKAIS